MRRIFIIGTILLLSLYGQAQSPSYVLTQNFTTTGTSVSDNLIGNGAAFHKLTWNVSGTVSGCTVALDSSADGVSWSAGGVITGQTCTTNGTITSSSTIVNYVRINMTAFTGTGSVSVIDQGYVNNPAGGGGGMVYPSGSGLAVVTGGSAWGTTAAQPTGAIVGAGQSNTFSTGTQDFSAVTSFRPKSGLFASIPATCTAGKDVYLATDATAGQNWYFCTATNTWTQQLNSGFSNPMTTLGDSFVGGASGVGTRLAGPTSPNGVPLNLTSTPSGGAATAQAWLPGGVPINAQTGTTYTVLITDRGSLVTYNNAGAVAVTLPQAGTSGFSNNFVTLNCNKGPGTATITPTTSTFTILTGAAFTSGNTTLALTAGQCAWIYSDNANYVAVWFKGATGYGSCTEAWGGSGSSFALTSGDDAVVNNTCYNDSGATRTITAVKCRSDNASNTTTVNPTFGSAGTGTTILSGALTCGNSYAYSSSGTVSNAAWTTGTGIRPVMAGTLTGTSISMIVEYTY